MDGVSLGCDVMMLLQAQASGHGEAAVPTSEAQPTSHPACEGAPWQTHGSRQIEQTDTCLLAVVLELPNREGILSFTMQEFLA